MKLPTSQWLGRGCTLSHLLVQLSLLTQMLVLPEAGPGGETSMHANENIKEKDQASKLLGGRGTDLGQSSFPSRYFHSLYPLWVWNLQAEPNVFVIRDAPEGLSVCVCGREFHVLLAKGGVSSHPTDPSLAQFLNHLCPPPEPHGALPRPFRLALAGNGELPR